MYAFHVVLFIFAFIYIYLLIVCFKKNLVIIILFLIYSLLSFLVIFNISNIYYLYFMYELLNICIYLVLIYLSQNPINFKSLTQYYFIRFISSLLFLISLYDATENALSTQLINASILIKLGVYPFSNIISNIYKNSSFSAYITLNYYISLIY